MMRYNYPHFIDEETNLQKVIGVRVRIKQNKRKQNLRLTLKKN